MLNLPLKPKIDLALNFVVRKEERCFLPIIEEYEFDDCTSILDNWALLDLIEIPLRNGISIHLQSSKIEQDLI